MKLSFICICLIVFALSCQTLLKDMYHMGRQINYKTKKEYTNYLVNKKGFPIDNIVFFDSISYLRFSIEAMEHESAIVYYGTFVNDSTEIKKSSFLKDNQSCMGRMEKEISGILSKTTFADSALLFNPNIIRNQVYYLKDDTKMPRGINNKRIRICLFYSYSFGNYYDKLYKEIFEIQKQYPNEVDLLIISLDPVYYLKNKKL